MRTDLAACAALALSGAWIGPGMALSAPEAADFDASALAEPAQVVSCTLANGEAAECLQLVVSYKPAELEIGPFCPATLEDAGGLWDWDGENAGLYRIDGEFLEMLGALGYRFFDDEGNVYINDGTVPPDAEHMCLSMAQDESVKITALLPLSPVMAEAPSALGTVAKVGLALDGVPIFADAPSVLERNHMPALDVCGGHIDPGGWYHWHATATDVQTTLEHEHVQAECAAVAQNATAMFAYAFDGFAMMGSLEADGSAPEGLDACNGHMGEEGYHYHASAAFPNLPPCLVGVVAENNFATTAKAGIGAAGGPGGPGGGDQGGVPPGFDEAAARLGVRVEALDEALRAAGGPGADLAEVAEALGVSEAALREALPLPTR